MARVARIACLLLVAACDGGGPDGDNDLPTCDQDDRDDTYVAGIAKVGAANYTLRLMDSTPSPPSKGDNAWLIDITDPVGKKSPGLDLIVSTLMVDHDHTPPVKPASSDDGDGAYTIDPVNLFMPGYWEISITVVDPGEAAGSEDDVTLDSVLFKFCVEG